MTQYDIWLETYCQYLKDMYVIFKKFTKSEVSQLKRDTFTQVRKNKDTNYCCKSELILFDDFCRFIYTYSSGYITPYA